jgi:hypothetical protein
MPPSGTSRLMPLSASLAGAPPSAAYSLTRLRMAIAGSAVDSVTVGSGMAALWPASGAA